MRHVAVATVATATLATDLAVGWDWRVALAAGVVVLVFGEVLGYLFQLWTGDTGPGATGRPVPRTGLRPLTPRQAQVARLVADGLTNKEIAKRIGRGVRGVDATIQHIYTRLDIHNRAELTRWVLEREPPPPHLGEAPPPN